MDQICDKIELQACFKDALVIKKGFPPRPTEVNKAQTLQEAGFSPREKLIVSVDDEKVEKLRAELPEEDAMEVLRRQVEEEKKTMQG